MKNYLVTYRHDGIPPQTVKADAMKYDAGVIMLIAEKQAPEQKSRVVAVFNSEAVRDVIEKESIQT